MEHIKYKWIKLNFLHHSEESLKLKKLDLPFENLLYFKESLVNVNNILGMSISDLNESNTIVYCGNSVFEVKESFNEILDKIVNDYIIT